MTQDRFHRALLQKMNGPDGLRQRKVDEVLLAQGGTAEEIALKLKQNIGYLAALKDVESAAAEIEKSMYVDKPEEF